MARIRHRLTVAAVNAMRKPGLHADGDGLYLRVTSSGTKGWIFRFKTNGRRRDAGLGRYPSISLAYARKQADAFREQLACGMDPIDVRKAERAVEIAKTVEPWTFERCARAYIASHECGWRNDKHRAQWRSTLGTYAYPMIGSRPVDDIDVSDVMKVLQPIWSSKPETASRVRGRIERVLSWAKAQGYRTAENPAQWRGHLDQLLPAKSKVRKVVHYAALPFSKVPCFVGCLAEQVGVAPKALEFLILTAARTGETLGAVWDEIDLDRELWVVPAERSKTGREHRVPLTPRAVEIAKSMSATRCSQFVFPGTKLGRPLSQMALAMVLRRLRYDHVTVHGFRSSFRDWAAECTNYSGEVVECALAHTIANSVEAAYRRGDLLTKRRQLMLDWASFVYEKDAEKEVKAG